MLCDKRGLPQVGEMAMPRFDVATDTHSCPECGARFIVAPCRSCKGKGQGLLFLKCKECDATGKKTVCPNFLSHLRAQPGSQTSSPKRHPINDGNTRAAATRRVIAVFQRTYACPAFSILQDGGHAQTESARRREPSPTCRVLLRSLRPTSAQPVPR